VAGVLAAGLAAFVLYDVAFVVGIALA